MFHDLALGLSDWIEIIPVEYNHVIDIEKNDTFDEMLNEVVTQIIRLTNDQPFAIFGYSMGSLIAYEVYYEIVRRTDRKPIHMFFAAHVPPNRHVPYDFDDVTARKRLEANLKIMGWTLPKTEYQDLLDWVMPKFLGDLRLYSRYKYKESRELISTNITVLFSDQENQQGQIYDWAALTSKFCMYHHMGNHHFFIHTEVKDVAKKINEAITTELIQPILNV